MTIFSKTDRTLMQMLFQRGTVTEIDGVIPGTERRWNVCCYRPNLFRDETHYEGYISGVYGNDFRGDTLDETLDAMEALLTTEEWMAELQMEAI